MPKQEKVPYYSVPLPINEKGEADWGLLDANAGQDYFAWITQGEIADRTQEWLGESDVGIITYRRMLTQQLNLLADGGEPMNTFRDPENNQCIYVPWQQEEDPWAFQLTQLHRAAGSTKYSPVAQEMAAKILGKEALEEPVH
jgi:5,5'-dehydrodivanillate O-demethylase